MRLFDRAALANRTIVVTGASSGIGKAAALELARAGARVVLIGRDAGRLEQALAEANQAGAESEKPEHLTVSFDLNEIDEIPALIKKISTQVGALAGLFHCAGVESIRPINLVKTKSIDETFKVAVGAGLMLARAFAQPGVKNDSGTSLVYMSSVAGQRGQSGMSVYCAAKAAVDGMVRSLAVELSAKNIRVNSIQAGAVVTEMHERLTQNLPAASIDEYEKRHLLGFGRSEDVANMALFLLSDAARWMTGACVAVDGGYLAK